MSRKVAVLQSLIKDGGAFTFAQITCEVEQKMLKTGNPLKMSKITKLINGSMALNGNYATAVNNQRIREGKEADFVAKDNWHRPVFDGFNGSISCHKDDETRLYLKVRLTQPATTEKYYVDGIEATAEQVAIIKQYRQKSSAPTNQGIETPVIIRTFHLEGIKTVKCGETVIFE